MAIRLASALAGGKQELLWKHGLGLNDDQINFGTSVPARVAVLVESPEHGRELQKLLSGWALLAAIPTTKGGGNTANNPATPMLPDRSIITMVFASKLKLFDPNMLIVASADDWTREISGFPPRSKAPPLPQVTVIDVADDFDDTAIRNVQRRLDAYRCRGWRVTAPRRWTDEVKPTGRSRRSHRP